MELREKKVALVKNTAKKFTTKWMKKYVKQNRPVPAGLNRRA